MVDRDPPFTIRCSCGEITFKGFGQPVDVSTCHCKTCRAIPSQPLYRTFAKFDWNQIELDKAMADRVDVRQTSEIAQRAFCKRCDDVIYMTHDFLPKLVGFPVEIIWGHGMNLETTRHIFVEDADPNFQAIVNDDKPRYARFPDHLAPKVCDVRSCLQVTNVILQK
jgi:hypothetical protein